MQNVVSNIGRRVAAAFLSGLLVIMPLVLTVAIVIWVAGFLRGLIGPDTILGGGLEWLGLTFASDKTVAYVAGWVFVLATILLLGVIIQAGAKKYLQRFVDSAVQRIPIIGNIYGTSKQLVEMFDRKNESELKSMSVVFCFFGKDRASGALALMPSPERFEIDGRHYHVVIIPTAPVPFGGGLLFMPVESIKSTEISVDGLMSIYVSMGVTTPQFLNKSSSV